MRASDPPSSWVIFDHAEKMAGWGIDSAGSNQGQVRLLSAHGVQEPWLLRGARVPTWAARWDRRNDSLCLIALPRGAQTRLPEQVLDFLQPERICSAWCHFGGRLSLGDDLLRRWHDWDRLDPQSHEDLRRRLGGAWHPQPVSRHLGLPWEQEFREAQEFTKEAFGKGGLLTEAEYATLSGAWTRVWRKAFATRSRAEQLRNMLGALQVSALLDALKCEFEAMQWASPKEVTRRAVKLWNRHRMVDMQRLLEGDDEFLRELQASFGPICGDLFSLADEEHGPALDSEQITSIVKCLARFEAAWKARLASPAGIGPTPRMDFEQLK